MNRKGDLMRKLLLAAIVGLMALAPLNSFAAPKFIVKKADGTTDKFVIYDDNTGLSTNAYGEIGINNPTPDAAIHAKGDAYPTATLKLEGTPAGGGAGFLAYNSRPAPALPLNNDRLGYFLFGTMDTNTNPATPRHGAGITASADADWTSTSTPVYFAFLTTPVGSTTRYDRLHIASSGNVGINNTTPATTLDVAGSVRVNSPGSQPTCTDSIRGTFWFTQGAGQAKDSLQICVSNGSLDTWVTLY